MFFLPLGAEHLAPEVMNGVWRKWDLMGLSCLRCCGKPPTAGAFESFITHRLPHLLVSTPSTNTVLLNRHFKGSFHLKNNNLCPTYIAEMMRVMV